MRVWFGLVIPRSMVGVNYTCGEYNRGYHVCDKRHKMNLCYDMLRVNELSNCLDNVFIGSIIGIRRC